MTSHDRADRRGGIAGRTLYRFVGTAVLVAALGLVVIWIKVVRGSQEPVSSVETFVVKRGPVTISVLEAGALKAKDPEIICSSLQGRAAIISIIPEGTRVNQGDLLVELDVTQLVDHRVDHEIMVRNAEAAWINARETLVITKSLAQSNIEAAQLKYDFAKLDLAKYKGDGGELATSMAKAKGDIALSEQELKKNQDYYAWSKRLADEKYLSTTQLQADELTMKRSELNLTVANNSLKLLEEYNSKRELAQRLSDVNQAAALLDRAKAKARANIAQAEAMLAAHEQEYQRNLDMLAKLDDQISKGKIYAPTEGMVVYATSRGGGFHDDRQPLADGVEVWQRQELIYLPRSSSTVAEVAVHEANLQKVRVGLPAIVTMDALPGVKFMGTVSRIAPLPDPQGMWMNPDLKIYKTEIALDVNDPQLRSGMNCKAEIIVEQHADSMYVPVQTVVRVGGQPTVYVLHHDGETEERRIEVGLDDNTRVRVVSGLSEGDQVVLAPSPRAGSVAAQSRRTGIRGADANEMMQQIRERLKVANESGASSRKYDNASPEERQKMMSQFRGMGGRRGGQPGDGPGPGQGADGGRGPGGRPEQGSNQGPRAERTQ